MTKVYLMNISNVNNYSDIYFEKHFPKRLERAHKFIFEEDQKRCIAAGILLYKILNINEAELKYNPYGKPYADYVKPFSISHSGNIAALAVGDKPLGVDIELNNINNISVMNDVCTENEILYINNSKNISTMKDVYTDNETLYADNKVSKFYQIWTLKEGLSKAIGFGLNISFKDIDVLSMLNHSYVLYDKTKYYGITAVIENNMTLSLVSQEPENRFDLNWL